MQAELSLIEKLIAYVVSSLMRSLTFLNELKKNDPHSYRTKPNSSSEKLIEDNTYWSKYKMGISFSSALGENERQGNVNMIHELHSLERKVCHKIEEQASKLYVDALHDECLPIVCAVDKKQKILLNVDSVSSDEVTTKINEVLHGDYLEELIKLLAEKLNSTLGTTTVGEEEGLYTHVVFANKSVLRIDLFVYHRRFRRTENLSVYNNILAYFVQVGLVEIIKARPQVLIYELTRATDQAKLNNACEKLEAFAKCKVRLNYIVETRPAKVHTLPTGKCIGVRFLVPWEIPTQFPALDL